MRTFRPKYSWFLNFNCKSYCISLCYRKVYFMLKCLRCIFTYQLTSCAGLSPVRCYLFPAQKYEVDHGSDLPFYVKSVIENLLFSFLE